MRQSLYLRESLDADILKVVKPLLKKQSFAHVIRELIRDGMKYREMITESKSIITSPNITQSNTATKPYKPKATGVKYDNRTQSSTFTPTNKTKSLSDIKLQKKEVADKDIESRLDSF